jgi:hypothetical protein
MPVTKSIHFTRNVNLLQNQANAAIDVTVADPALLAAPFRHQQTDLSAISVTAAGGEDVTFKSGGAGVAFHLSAGAKAGAGVYLDGDAIATALSLDSDTSLDMPSDLRKHYTMIRCGFDFAASVNGSMALGAGGAVSLGLDGSVDAGFGVIRRFIDNSATGLQELTDVANSWKLPMHIASDADLDPGTWIVSEVGGMLAVKLGAQYGLDYNWIRTLQLGGMDGDIGLRLQLGINAALGLCAAGTYVIVVSRESPAPSDRVLRLRLFRRSERGWSFALNAGAALTSQAILPNHVDDFISAVLGVHGAQAISDLHAFKAWNGDKTTLGGLLAAAGVDRAQKLLGDVTGVDPRTAFNFAHAKFDNFLKLWDGLDHRVSTLILKFVGDHVDLGPIKQIAGLIDNGTPPQFAAFLADKLKDVAFFQTPEGQYLESLSSDGLVSLLASPLDMPAFAAVKGVAQKTLAVLDGGEVESILTKLQNELAIALDLQPLVDLAHPADQATVNSLDALLQAKLAAFLNKTFDKTMAGLGVQDVENIRLLLQKLLARRNEFYQKAKGALEREYQFSLATTYQSGVAKSALFDVEFDFATGDSTMLSGFLRNAIAGRLDEILVNRVAGISLNKALLTHHLKRQAHVEFNMPHFMEASDSLLLADAEVTPVETRNGRLLMYDLTAHEQGNVRINAMMRRSSALSVGAHFGQFAGGDVRIHQSHSLSYAYNFRQAMKSMKPHDFKAQAGAYIDAYFAELFASGAGTRAAWLSRFEGNILLTLSLSVPASIGAQWFIPADANENLRVLRMKRALLASLQSLIPFYYFSDLSKFQNTGFGTTSLLVYEAAEPQFSEFGSLSDDVLRNIADRTGIGEEDSPLGHVLNYWSARLKDADGPNQNFFENNGSNRAQIISGTKNTLGSFRSLMITTQNVLESAEKSRAQILKFLATAPDKPSEALAHLADFGKDLVDTFNRNTAGIYGGSALEPLGTLAFMDAARALGGLPVSANAMFDVTVVKPGVDPLAFIDNDPGADQIVNEDRLVAAGATPSLPLLTC